MIEKDFLKYTLPCGHNGAGPMDGCKTCTKFLEDDLFRSSVIASQEQIKSAFQQKEKKKENVVELCRYISDAPVDRLDCDCPRKWVHSCEIYGRCCRDNSENDDNMQSCSVCPQYVPRSSDELDKDCKKVVLQNKNAPGDTVAMTAAVEALHLQHPGKYVTWIESPSPDVWIGNPYATRLYDEALQEAKKIQVDYDDINKSNDLPITFIEAYCNGLSKALDEKIFLHRNTPFIKIQNKEKSWLSQVGEIVGTHVPYIIINAGYKSDFTAKYWGRSNWMKLVSLLKDECLMVQVGEKTFFEEGKVPETIHYHEPIPGVLDLIGKTTQRQLIRLAWNAKLGIGPSTFLQHVCAAVETPYVLIAGGREPLIWQHYPRQYTFSSIGTLPCCERGGCWRSRTVKIGDGKAGFEGKDKLDNSICSLPVLDQDGSCTPKCLKEIDPEEVADKAKKMLRIKK